MSDPGWGLALGLLIGVLVGAAGGAALTWRAMRVTEKLIYGGREGRPVLSDWDVPLEQSHTGGTMDTDEEEQEVSL